MNAFRLTLFASLLTLSGVAAAKPAGAKPADDKAKTVKIAEDAANDELRREYGMNDCPDELPKGYKFVDPSKAVLQDKSGFWKVIWKGTTPEGYGFEVAVEVDKDNSGSYVTDFQKVTCKK